MRSTTVCTAALTRTTSFAFRLDSARRCPESERRADLHRVDLVEGLAGT